MCNDDLRMIYAALSIFLINGDVIRQGFRPVEDESGRRKYSPDDQMPYA